MKNTSKELTQVFEGISLNVTPDEVHGFIMATEDVAKGYGISASAIRDHKRLHADELIESKHWFLRDKKTLSWGNLITKQTFWTKSGVIRLGFFIKSESSKRFRDWAEDLIDGQMSGDNSEYLNLEDLAFFGESDSKEVVFHYGKFPVRCVACEDGVYRFVGKDITACCGYKGNRSRIERIVPERYMKKISLESCRGARDAWSVNSDGLLFFLKHSKRGCVAKFSEWVGAVLLPSVSRLEQGETLVTPQDGTRRLPPHMVGNITAAMNKAIAKEVAGNVFKALQSGKIRLSF